MTRKPPISIKLVKPPEIDVNELERIARTIRQPIRDESETNQKLALLARAIAGMP